jgi:hypothetical protein
LFSHHSFISLTQPVTLAEPLVHWLSGQLVSGIETGAWLNEVSGSAADGSQPTKQQREAVSKRQRVGTQ